MAKTLTSEYPAIAAELQDQSLTEQLAPTSHRKVEWKCPSGHIYEATVASRTSMGSNCPYCSNRKVLSGYNDLLTTHPALAEELVNIQDGTTVTAGSKKKLAWRCPEGHTYEAAPAKRTRKDKTPSGCPYCAGKKVLAGFNDLATTHPDIARKCAHDEDARTYSAMSNKTIEWICQEHGSWKGRISQVVMGQRVCPQCNTRKAITGVSDLATLRPDIAAQMAEPSIANSIRPQSNVTVEWHCPECGGTWHAKVQGRVREGVGCPYCAGKTALQGFNDLATTHPDLAKELVNKDDALTVTAGSHKRLLWRCSKGHEWLSPVQSRAIAGTGCPACANTGTSRGERELADAIRSLLPGQTVLSNCTSILPNGYELDVAIPNKHIAFEFNGLLWHSNAFDEKHARTRHAEKSKLAAEAGYRLIHIWEDDWRDKRDIVIRAIAAKLGATENLPLALPNIDPAACQTIGARKLHLSAANTADARAFLENNHVQGFASATRHFALSDKEGRIRALLSVRSPRANARMHRKEGQWEIQRYATLGTVPGGFSRLLAYAESQLINEGFSSWVTFADLAISDGQLYETCGFTLDGTLPPDYRYVGNATGWIRRPKERFQKKRFRDDPGLAFDENLTERQLALMNSLFRIYDAGKLRYVREMPVAHPKDKKKAPA